MSEQAALGSHLGLRRGGGRALLEVCVGSQRPFRVFVCQQRDLSVVKAERGTGKPQRCVHAADRKAEDLVSPGRGRPRCRDGLGATAAPRAGAGDEQQPQMFPRRERWASRWEIKPGPRKDTPSKGAAGLGRNLEGAARLVCLPRPVRARKLCQPCSPRGHQNVSQELHENTQWQFRGKNMLR